MMMFCIRKKIPEKMDEVIGTVDFADRRDFASVGLENTIKMFILHNILLSTNQPFDYKTSNERL